MRRCSGASTIITDGAYPHGSPGACEKGQPVCVSCVIHDLAMVFGCGNGSREVRMGNEPVRMSLFDLTEEEPGGAVG